MGAVVGLRASPRHHGVASRNKLPHSIAGLLLQRHLEPMLVLETQGPHYRSCDGNVLCGRTPRPVAALDHECRRVCRTGCGLLVGAKVSSILPAQAVPGSVGDSRCQPQRRVTREYRRDLANIRLSRLIFLTRQRNTAGIPETASWLPPSNCWQQWIDSASNENRTNKHFQLSVRYAR